jgi:putative transposase
MPSLNRRSQRLPGYDYTTPGVYFVTIVTHDRARVFGEVVGGEMRLSRPGEIAQHEWSRLPARFSRLVLSAFVVMPDHIHGILILNDVDSPGNRGTGLLDNTDNRGAFPRAPTPRTTLEIPSRGTGVNSTNTGQNGPPVPRNPTPCTPLEIPGRGTGVNSTNTGQNGPPVPRNPSTIPPSHEEFGAPVPGSIPTIIRSYKSSVTQRLIWLLGFQSPIWQRGYYERILRTDESLEVAQAYILANPANWAADHGNPL